MVCRLVPTSSAAHRACASAHSRAERLGLAESAERRVSLAPQPLQSLSLADSKLKAEVTIIINALGSNTSLTKVDISGNGMGDMGAKMLAKALQINTKLR